MKKIILKTTFILILFFLLSSFTSLHTYYISICNIEYYDKSNEMGITFKFTTHDMEKAIIRKSKINLHLGEKKEHPKSDSLLTNYILDHFNLKSDKEHKIKFIGKETNLDETLLVHFEIKNVTNPSKIEIENTLLTEVFSRQENVVHLKTFKKTRTHSFNKINTNYTFTTK